MQTLNEVVIDWQESRLIRKLCTDKNVKLRLDKGETTIVYWNRS
jgi:hypothetical protein